MKLNYVDVFYHHVFDPNTPLEETALALDHAVRQGKQVKQLLKQETRTEKYS